MIRSFEGEHDLAYQYDHLNRLKKILDEGQSMRPVTENSYDSAPGNGLGKLHSTKQHNYIVNVQNLPWNATPGEDVEVSQRFSFLGLGGPNLDTGILTYDGAGNLKTAGATTYTYERVGRLANSINTNGNDQAFFYDRFGNMNVHDFDFTIETIDPRTNRFIGGNYDLAGNLLSFDPGLGGWNWFYNRNNKVTAQNTLNYVYDSFGERIDSYTTGGAKYHIRDALGQRRTTFQNTGQAVGAAAWERGSDFVLSGGRILGSSNPRGRFHFHLDQLGNTRIVTNENGVEAYDYHYAPYGFEYNTGYGGTIDQYFTALFTGH